MRRAMMLNCARRGGMTIVELTIGLMITGMVMASLAAVWSALGDSWASSSSPQQITLTANQADLRLTDTLRQTRYLCQYGPGSLTPTTSNYAYIPLWKSDNWAVAPATAPDGQPQLAELVLIEHNPNDQKIYSYEAIASSAMTSSQKTRAAGVATWVDLSASTTPGIFKGYDFVRKKTLAEAVTGMKINLPTMTTGAKQLVEYTLKLNRGGNSTVIYGTGTVRGPSTKPS